MAIAPFDLRLERNADAWTVRCRGELDLAAAGHLGEATELALGRKPSSLTIDCRDVVFIDSEGIRVLLRIARDAHERGIEYHLELSELVDDTLSRLGILERLMMAAGPPAGPAT